MNKIGRPKIDRKEIAEKLKELEKSYNNKVITQEFCAEKLGITHRTFCNIIKSSFDFSILDTEQIKESDKDPYVYMLYLPAPGKIISVGPKRGTAEHQKLLFAAANCKKRGNNVYLFTESQMRSDVTFTPRLSSEDIEIRDFAIRHGWGQKKARK